MLLVSVAMTVLDIHSQDGGLELDELDFIGLDKLTEGPSYEELLAEETKIASFDQEAIDRSAYSDGYEVGQLTLADELLEAAPGGLASQAEAARWARWVAYQLQRVQRTPKL